MSMSRNKLCFMSLIIICACIVYLCNDCIASKVPAQKRSVINSGICRVRHRVQRTRYEGFYETFLRRILWRTTIQTRRNYRIVSYVDWEWTDVCCDGYELRELSVDRQCEPRCESGCTNGKCNNPNNCDCLTGYLSTINNVTGWSECTPICSNDCVHGRCKAPNICDCDPGFVAADDQASCEPSCASIGYDGSQGCGNNAKCIAPNLCRCEAGYEVTRNPDVTNGSSSLIMDQSLSTDPGTTVTPTATTDESVFSNNEHSCKPTCSQSCFQNASCVAPDVCDCDPGYSVVVLSHHIANVSRQCFPVCEKMCVNAFCSYPNSCTCAEGYRPATNDSFECEPICDNDCVNAVCTKPDYCECIDGYEKSSRLKHPEHICAPICSGGCLNGNCVGPDTCVCNEGYIFTYEENNDTKSLTCQPHCTPPCLNGSLCIAPGQCQLQLPVTYVDGNCNSNGGFSKVNGSCLCNYGWTGSKCNEPKFCGIFIAGNKSNEQFIGADRVYYPGEWDWTGPKCNKECHSILSLKMAKNTSPDAIRCYHLKLLEQTAGLVSTELPLLDGFDESDDMVFCFLAADSLCNVMKSSGMSIIFGSLSFLLIVGCGIISYRYRHRFRRITRKPTLDVTDDIMEPLRTT